MKTITKPAWLPIIALLGLATAVLGLARSESTPQPTPIKIWDAAFYDSEDCKPGPEAEVACPDYTLRIQGKTFTSHIQNECDSQMADNGVRKCTIAVDMKFFRDEWGFHGPSIHHPKSMWVDYECNPGTTGSKRMRAFGDEATDKHPEVDITMVCGGIWVRPPG
jgi:hypothetical protein